MIDAKWQAERPVTTPEIPRPRRDGWLVQSIHALTQLRFLLLCHTLRHQLVSRRGLRGRCRSPAFARDVRPPARLILERVDEQHARPEQLVALQCHVEQMIEDRAFLVKERFSPCLPRGKADGQRLLDGGEIARQQFWRRRAER
jgi:hypothetical protein